MKTKTKKYIYLPITLHVPCQKYSQFLTTQFQALTLHFKQDKIDTEKPL